MLGIPAAVVPQIIKAERDLLAWAEHYAAVGLKPLPRRRGSKHPGIPVAPYQDRYPTADERRDWFTDPSVTGVCVVLDGTGFVVLELDAANRERMKDARALLETAGIPIPHACPRVFSGSGRSAQFWFRDPRRRITRRHIAAVVHPDGPAKQGGAQLDILGAGIVVVPPTLHPATNKPYRWWPPFLAAARVPELA
jgi:hypothetical protein